MNKTYRSVWNESTQTYVAAQETAAARGKRNRRSVLVVASSLAFAGMARVASAPAEAAITAGYGGLNLCSSGSTGWTYGSSTTSAMTNCNLPGGTGSFLLLNAADTNGGNGYNLSTARILGYANGKLEFMGAGPGGIIMDNQVSMTSNKIVNLAPGIISASSMDAVNGSQLYGLSASTAAAMGGGSVVNTNGSISAPTYVVNGSTYNNVGAREARFAIRRCVVRFRQSRAQARRST